MFAPAASAAGAVPDRAVRSPPAPGRAPEPGLRHGGYPLPASGPPRRPGQGRRQPVPPRGTARADERPGPGKPPRRPMLAPMKRTALGLRKEITVFEYERGLLY